MNKAYIVMFDNDTRTFNDSRLTVRQNLDKAMNLAHALVDCGNKVTVLCNNDIVWVG